MKIRYLLIQFAAWLANRQPAPREYSLSNPGNPIQNFCYFSIIFKDGQEFQRFRVKSFTPRTGFSGSLLAKDISFDAANPDFVSEASLSLKSCVGLRFSIRRVFGTTAFEYTSVWSFLLSEFTLRHRRIYLQKVRSQRKFQKEFRFSREHNEVLKEIVDWQLGLIEKKKNSTKIQEFGSIDLMIEMKSIQFFSLDKHQKYLTELDFILDSLAISGELKTFSSGKYTLTGKALQSLSDYEKASQRERLSDRTNNSIKWSNTIIALATVLSVIMALFDNFKDFTLK